MSDVQLNFKEHDLVMLRLQGEYGFTNTWWRVLFIDNDNTFVGMLERCHRLEYKGHQLTDHDHFACDSVQAVHKDGDQFCYSNNVSTCSCTGLCRDK